MKAKSFKKFLTNRKRYDRINELLLKHRGDKNSSLKTEQYSAFFTFLLLSAETGKLHERTHFMPSGLRRCGASVSKAMTGRSIKDTCVQS